MIASAPATHQLTLVDARSGSILAEFDTHDPVYAPPASDGTSVYTASIGGIVEATSQQPRRLEAHRLVECCETLTR